MKFISWNVNGLRACVNKGFTDSFYQLDADFFCLQETKLQAGQIDLELPGYHQYWCYAQKKGYSGTAIFTKHEPLSVSYGLGVEELDTEGRLITLEYREFYLVTCYTPNAQRGLARIDHRMNWEKALRSYLTRLDSQKPVIYCGDLNVAHQEIDLKNPASNRGNAGFSDQERDAFTQLLSCGFTDSFRHLYPDVTGAYSWWSYMFNARQNNAGWRIDYFVVSDRLKDAIADATIHPDIMGSDHCPVGLDLNTTCNGSVWSPETPPPKQPTDNSADRESPAGAVRSLFKFGVGAAAVLGILIAGAWFLNRSKPEVPTETTETVSTSSKELIAEIRYLGDDVELVTGKSVYYRFGSEIWKPVKPLVDFNIYERRPTFYALVTFPEDAGFTEQTLPQVQYRQTFGDMYFYAPYLTHQFYYGSDGSVAGFLLMGDVPEDITTSLTVRYSNRITTKEVQITAERDKTDYSQYTTKQLVNTMIATPKLTQLRTYWISGEGVQFQVSSYGLEFFMTHNAAAAELLKREDALDTMFYVMDYTSFYTIAPEDNILILLGYEAFQAQMSEEQEARYQQLKLEALSAWQSTLIEDGTIIWEYGLPPE